MAQNPFKQNQEYTPNIKRNTFDLSFTNNLTFNFGQLVPVFCKEVLPTDNFRIDPTFALRFMPLVFPVQTKMRAYMHFFYCRNRAVWSNFPDRIFGNTSEAEHPTPFIVQSKDNLDLFRTGSLGDYLGLPTTLHGNVDHSNKFSASWLLADCTTETSTPAVYKLNVSSTTVNYLVFGIPFGRSDSEDYFKQMFFKENFFAPYDNNGSFYSGIPFKLSSSETDDLQKDVILRFSFDPTVYSIREEDCRLLLFGSNSKYHSSIPCESYSFYDSNNKLMRGFSAVVTSQQLKAIYRSYTDGGALDHFDCLFAIAFSCNGNRPLHNDFIKVTVRPYDPVFSDAVDKGVMAFTSECPINALPFRHYESIYNSYYRDTRNNPFFLNGKPQYNRFVTNLEDGKDTTNYHLFNRNWELDQFTSATQTPQFGDAPLVGIQQSVKQTANVTVTDPVTSETFTFEAQADENGNVNGVNVSDSVSPQTVRALVDYASSGISINDFRLTNSLQRFLETQIRRGMRYREQSKATWNVDIKFDTLNMPEFLGGVSCDVDINTVSCTSPNSDSPLGAYAGQATAFGATPNQINKFCDEHGYIIGILSVVPVPAYSQALPKHFTKFNTLDWYNPAFANIGNQPIPYKELCPIQVAAVDGDMDETFGYNRPWYDYTRSFDEVHGQFRTSLQNFVLHRTFADVPKLGSDFTTIQVSQLNNPFATDSGDKILGCINFKCEVSRGIPLISVPSIS